MNTFKKNQIIITALVVMIAIAGYLNFTESNDTNSVFITEENKTNEGENDSALVPNSDVAQLSESQGTEETQGDAKDSTEGEAKETSQETPENNVGEAVLVNNNSVEAGYFLNAKINREQDRAEYKESLLSIINNSNLGQEEKVPAVKEMVDLQEKIEKEAAAESLLEAKGFENVFVRITEDEVDVVVDAEELSEEEITQIYDIVKRKTGIDPEKITITPLNIEK